jgi:N6-adenosine-specific RNA methylase IME4
MTLIPIGSPIVSIAAAQLTPEAARRLTDEVKADVAALWAKLLRLYEGGAHVALGYSSWASYFETEFAQTGTRGYQLLDAARVRGLLADSTMVESLNERQARALRPLLDVPDDLRAVYTDLRAQYGDAVTAEVIRRAVQSRLGGDERRAAQAARIAAIATPGAFPAGRFPIIVADPGWTFEHVIESRAVENHYATLDLAAICAFTDPAGRSVADLATDDAMLFLWAPNPKILEAGAVIEAWGFAYRTKITWVKDRLGLGYYVRDQDESLLIARRGTFPVPAEPDRPPSVISAPRPKQHSAKPGIFYEIIETMYPGVGPRLELFARRPRPGWVVWGNEV